MLQNVAVCCMCCIVLQCVLQCVLQRHVREGSVPWMLSEDAALVCGIGCQPLCVILSSYYVVYIVFIFRPTTYVFVDQKHICFCRTKIYMFQYVYLNTHI